MDGMLGVIGGLITGVCIALFLPFAVALGAVIIFLIIALLPQMQMLRMFALIALLTIVLVTVIRLYVWNQVSESLAIVGIC